MREILFRGKHVEDGKWFFGCLVHRTQFYGIPDDDYFILYDGEFHCDFYGSVEVDLKTLGQYTGLADKNGKKIFEGDIGRYKQTDGAKWNGKPIICTGKVIYNTKTASFAVDSIDEIGAKNYDYFPIKDFEVIGNIHDNPELLKSGAE